MRGWISVDERLPNEDQLVVAARIYPGETLPDAAVCLFYNSSFNLHEDGIEAQGDSVVVLDMGITHWYPLPQ